jgi:hypothetical protein
MAITLTGTKYSGNVTSYISRILTINGASFTSGNFTTPRIVSIFDNADNFKGVGYIRRWVSATSLEMEYDFFDPATNEVIAITATDRFDVSVNLSEVATSGLTVSNTEVVVSDSLYFGISGNSRSLCLYDEEKDIRQTGGPGWQLRGGVTIFGHLLSTSKDLSCHGPVNIVFSSGFTLITKSTAGHFAMYGGSIFAQSTPAYFGGYTGSQAGTLLLSKTTISQIDLISVGAGSSWGSNAGRHILRQITHAINKNNAIAMRWGDGVIEGGAFKMSGAVALSLFGTDRAGTYNIGAVAGERLVAQEVGDGTSIKPNFFRSNGAVTINVVYTNLISQNRRHVIGVYGARNVNATASFSYKDKYKNGVLGTKVFILKTDGSTEDSGEFVSTDDLELQVLEASITGGDIEVVEGNNWNWAALAFSKNIVSGSFATTVMSTISGDAKNVEHGANLLQTDDLDLTETNKATVDAYTTLDNSFELYDRAKSDLYDNYLGETATTVSRSGALTDAGAYNVTIDATASSAFAISGNTITIKASTFTGDMTTTGVITLANGAVFNGTRTDANGTVSPPRIVSVTGIVAGSRLRIYNSTTSTEVYNAIVSGTSYTASYAEGTGYSQNDVLDVRVAEISKLEFSSTVVASATGWSLLVTQEANTTYASYGVDGSTVAGITWDGGNMEFDFNDADNQVAGGDIAAWYFHFITTATGIAEAFGAISWPQINRVSNRTATLAITFDNKKADPLKITGAWIDRDDGATIIASASNSVQIDPPAVFIKETGVSGLTPAESVKLDLISTVDGKVDQVENNTALIPALL